LSDAPEIDRLKHRRGGVNQSFALAQIILPWTKFLNENARLMGTSTALTCSLIVDAKFRCILSGSYS